MKSQNFKLSDGRNLDLLFGDNFEELSKSGKHAIVFHHGTPSCAYAWAEEIDLLDSLNIPAIAYSRAGYHTSDRKVGRSVVDVNLDIKELINNFGVKKFTAIGWSGGGPHALANGLMNECTSVVVLAGVGPYGKPDLDFLAGMGQDNHEEFGAALAGETELVAWMEINGPALRVITGGELRETDGNLFSANDRKLMKDQNYSEHLAKNFRDSLSVSYYGWIDDDFVFIKDWGFELSSITKPVTIFQGDEDLMVPKQHGKWLLNNLPQAEIIELPGFGHMGLFMSNKEVILSKIKS
jgi:pimeloyl-ACP methyl ester carboxylesterase